MHCPSCGFENLEGLRFCGKCGSSLTPSCPQCGFVNPADFTFCGKCGSPLSLPPMVGQKQRRSTARRGKRSKAQTPKARGSRPALPAAERRQLTVEFIDLV